MDNIILSTLIFLPLAGVLIMFIVYFMKLDEGYYKYTALLTVSIQLILTAWLYSNFDPATLISADNIANPTKFVVQVPWIDSFNIQYFIGVDGLSMPMVMLTSLLMFICFSKLEPKKICICILLTFSSP